MQSSRIMATDGCRAARPLCWILSLFLAIVLTGCSDFFQGVASPRSMDPRLTVGETNPSLVLEPSGGYAGTYVDLSGEAWAPSAMVVVKLADEQGRSAVLAATSTDGTGEFRTGFLYPIGEQIVSAQTAGTITDMLSDSAARAPTFGSPSPLELSRPAAAKTGTTSEWRDNWTVGYTRDLLVGVWAGNADGHPMRGTSGLTGAAPIWHEFMEAVLSDPSILLTLDVPSQVELWQFEPP
jgi:hypothetical protein